MTTATVWGSGTVTEAQLVALASSGLVLLGLLAANLLLCLLHRRLASEDLRRVAADAKKKRREMWVYHLHRASPSTSSNSSSSYNVSGGSNGFCVVGEERDSASLQVLRKLQASHESARARMTSIKEEEEEGEEWESTRAKMTSRNEMTPRREAERETALAKMTSRTETTSVKEMTSRKEEERGSARAKAAASREEGGGGEREKDSGGTLKREERQVLELLAGALGSSDSRFSSLDRSYSVADDASSVRSVSLDASAALRDLDIVLGDLDLDSALGDLDRLSLSSATTMADFENDVEEEEEGGGEGGGREKKGRWGRRRRRRRGRSGSHDDTRPSSSTLPVVEFHNEAFDFTSETRTAVERVQDVEL